MKRLMIYFFYDKDGIVDDYVPYFLKSFRPYCEEICTVVNGNLADNSKITLEQNSNTLLIRENTGFDSGAYKYAIEHYGYEKIKEYDELILANFTMFGPIFSPQEMLDKMESQNVDFWGITKHPAENNTVAQTKINEHIQSYFVAFNKNILNSDSFKEYWETLKPASNYDEAVGFHELRLTDFFEGKGFKSGCFISNEKYADKIKDKVYYYYIYQQVSEDKIPFIKRKIFNIKKSAFIHPIEKGAAPLLDYIKNNTDYDIELIRKNIQRTELYKTNYKKLILRFLNLFVCKYIIFWKRKHYVLKLETVKQTCKFLKDYNGK